MITDLPIDLIKASFMVLETSPLADCATCGAVTGTCLHTDGLVEDALSQLDIPDEDEAPDELSGKKEEVIINPEYQTGHSIRTGF